MCIRDRQTQLNEESRQIGEQLDKKNAELTELQTQLEALQSQNTELNSQLESYAGNDGTLQTMEGLLNAVYIYLDTPEDMEGIAQALEAIDQESLNADTTSEAFTNLYNRLLEEVGPTISQTYLESGNSAYRDGDYETAIADLQRSFNYDETNGEALLLLGDAYNRNGDSRNAETIYNQVIDLFPNTEERCV